MKKLFILSVALALMLTVGSNGFAEEYPYDGKYGPNITNNREIIKEKCVGPNPHVHIVYLYAANHEVDLVVAVVQKAPDKTWKLMSYFYFLNGEFWALTIQNGEYKRLIRSADDIEWAKNDMDEARKSSKLKKGGL